MKEHRNTKITVVNVPNVAILKAIVTYSHFPGFHQEVQTTLTKFEMNHRSREVNNHNSLCHYAMEYISNSNNVVIKNTKMSTNYTSINFFDFK